MHSLRDGLSWALEKTVARERRGSGRSFRLYSTSLHWGLNSLPFATLGRNLQEGLTIGSREEDPLSCIATRGDVIDSSFVLNPQGACRRST